MAAILPNSTQGIPHLVFHWSQNLSKIVKTGGEISLCLEQTLEARVVIILPAAIKDYKIRFVGSTINIFETV